MRSQEFSCAHDSEYTNGKSIADKSHLMTSRDVTASVLEQLLLLYWSLIASHDVAAIINLIAYLTMAFNLFRNYNVQQSLKSMIA